MNTENKIEIKEVYIGGSECQFVGLKFLVDGKEEERFLNPDSLWIAIHEYYDNHLVDAKTYCNTD